MNQASANENAGALSAQGSRGPEPDGSPRATKRTLTRAEFERYSPLIRRQAMVLARRAPRSVTVSDLCARGFAGLFSALVTEAAIAADDLDAYVQARVRTAMLDHLLGLDPAVREARLASRQIARAIRALSDILGRPPERAEIAAALELDVDLYEAHLARIFASGIARIEVLGFDRPESIRNEDEPPLHEGSLAAAVASLDDVSREMLVLLYQEECKMAEAAAVMGLSEPRAAMLYTEAMHRLRASLGRE